MRTLGRYLSCHKNILLLVSLGISSHLGLSAFLRSHGSSSSELKSEEEWLEVGWPKKEDFVISLFGLLLTFSWGLFSGEETLGKDSYGVKVRLTVEEAWSILEIRRLLWARILFGLEFGGIKRSTKLGSIDGLSCDTSWLPREIVFELPRSSVSDLLVFLKMIN